MAVATQASPFLARYDDQGVMWLDFQPDTVLDGPHAPIFMGMLEEGMRERGTPLRVLVNMRRARGATASYRSSISAYLKEHGDKIIISCYDQNAFMAAMIHLVGKVTGMPIRSFTTEQQARAWLERGGT